jgi:hypothetical protein
MIKIFIFLLLFFISCSAQNSFKYTKYKFNVDNNNPTIFGYEKIEYDEDIGPKSIIIDNNIAYIVDTYHGNIKKVDLNTGILSSSVPLSPKNNLFLRDVIVWEEKILISSDLDSIYVLNSNLKFEIAIKTKRFDKYFLKANDSLFIYFSNEQMKCSLDLNGKLTNCVNIYIDNITPAHSKEYIVSNNNNISFIETAFFKIKLKKEIPKLYFRYDSINIDFDKQTLVYFDINKNFFELHVYMKQTRGLNKR